MGKRAELEKQKSTDFWACVDAFIMFFKLRTLDSLNTLSKLLDNNRHTSDCTPRERQAAVGCVRMSESL